jgi:membrane protease YdiL (CAAX protease family)
MGNEGVSLESEEEVADPLAGPPGPNFVRSGLLFYGAMAVIAVLWRVGWYGESIFFASPSVAAVELHWVRDLGMGVALGIVIVLLSGALTRFTAWGENLARSMARALGPISTPDCILLACASGLAEEMFFRGALQPRVGFVAASLLFGIVHFIPRREFLPWTGFALIVGFVFGALYSATGNLLAPVAAHAVINGINLPLLVKRYRGREVG